MVSIGISSKLKLSNKTLSRPANNFLPTDISRKYAPYTEVDHDVGRDPTLDSIWLIKHDSPPRID